MASEELGRQEFAQLQLLFDHSQDAIVLTDHRGLVTHWNEAAVGLFGQPASSILGRPIWDIQVENASPESRSEANRERLRAIIAEVLSGKETPWTREPRNVVVCRPDGQVRRVQSWLFVMPDDNGVRLGSIIRDVTSQWEVDQELRKLTQATEQSPATVIITGLDGMIQYVNRKFSELTGYTREEAIGQNPRILQSGKTPAEEYLGLWQTITSGREWRGFFQNRKKNGEEYWESATIAPIFDSDGRITHYVAVKEDITARKAAERILHCIASVRSEMSADLTLAEFCRRIIVLVGSAMKYPAQAIPVISMGTNLFARVVPVPPLAVCLTAEIMVEGKEAGRLQVGYPGGNSFSLPEEQDFLDIVAQSIGAFVSRSKADDLMRESLDRFELMFNKSPDAVVLTRPPDGCIVECNDRFVELIGFPRLELIGYTKVQMRIWDDPADRDEALRELEKGGSAGGREYRFRKRDGTAFIGLHMAWYLNLNGERHVMSLIRDLSDQKRTEEALRYQATLLSHVSDAIISTDLEHRILTMNTAAEAMYGLTEQEVRGRGDSEVFCTIYVDDDYVEVRRKLQETGFWKGEVEQSRKDGTRLNIHSSIALVRGANGHPTGVVAVNRNITDRKAAELALAKSENKFRTVIQNIDVYIYILDFEDGRISSSYHSPQCLAISGYGPEDFEADPELWLKIVHPDDLPVLREFFTGNRTGQTMPPQEHRIIRRDGELRWVLNSATVECDVPGEVNRVEGFVMDITKRVTMEHELRAAMKDAELANRAKSDFLASMSHELRTPLNAIIGFSQMLELPGMGDLNPKQRDFLRNVRVSSDHLLNMIASTLDLAKIEAGRMEIEKRPFRLAAMLDALMATMQAMAEKKAIKLSLRVEGELGSLDGDETKIRQVLFNLLTNALKFTPRGNRAGLEARPDGDCVIIVVWDEGVGIAASDQGRIFEAYEQVRVRNVANNGVGLGLFITQQLVGLHGGTISLSSQPGQGSRFTVRLPGRSDAALSSSEPVWLLRDGAESYGKPFCGRILIVEDSEISQELMRSIMESCGCQYAIAGTGEDAVAMAGQESYDLILMDIDLPGIDGLEATRRIQNQSKRQIPVIALTAHVMAGDAERFLAAGMDAVLAKPVEVSTLLSLLSEYGVEGPGDYRAVAEVPAPRYDASGTAASLGIDTERLMAIVRRFLDDLAVGYALALRTGIESHDLPGIRQAAHKFRGAAINLRFKDLAGILGEMETAAELGREVDYAGLLARVERELDSLRGELDSDRGSPGSPP